MDILKAIVYGLVQGLTEFIPVSSTAHLRVVPAFLGWEDPGSAFTAVIQLGTILAVLIYFWGDLSRAMKAWLLSLTGGPKDSVDARTGWAVFYATIPICIIGFATHKYIEGPLRSLWVIGATLIIMGLLMLVAEKRGLANRDLNDLTVGDGIKVGLWQCLALIPGMSRSGSTITGALLNGFDRASAARLSFLMSVPSITLAGLYEAFKERKAITGELLTPTIIATVVSFVVGFACIKWLIGFLQKKGTTPFVGYRIVLGIIILIACATGKLNPDPPKELTDVPQKTYSAS